MTILAHALKSVLRSPLQSPFDYPIGFAANDPVMSLFKEGEQGLWYDIQDTSTMYQDAVGTTPAALEQPVGLVLDKRLGLVGNDIVINGAFDSSESWTLLGAGVVISGGTLQFNTSDATPAALNLAEVEVGKSYEAIFVMSGYVSGGISLSNGAISTGAVFNSNGTCRQVFVCTQSGQIGIRARLGATIANIDNISVKEIPGNHATQNTTASKPTLSARKNLLTYSNDFDNAIWTKSQVAIVGNAATAPDGTMTADKVIPSTADGAHYVAMSSGATGQSVYSIHAKAGEYPAIHFGNAARYISVNLLTGAVLANASVANYRIEPLEDGWYRLSIVEPTTTGYQYQIFPHNGTTDLFVGDGTSGIYVWGAHIGRGQDLDKNEYQWINAYNDYDTDGFPYYLKFDGFDDFLSTGTIDFTGTDEMTVFAGVRKLSDAARGMVVELGAGLAANVFRLEAPFSSAGTFAFLGGGSTITGQTRTGFAAPATAVLTGQGDISGDSVSLRVNTTAEPPNTADQGAGNFVDQPLYIGRRGGTSLPFNGHLYALVVRGATTDAAVIEKVEDKINKYLKAY